METIMIIKFIFNVDAAAFAASAVNIVPITFQPVNSFVTNCK